MTTMRRRYRPTKGVGGRSAGRASFFTSGANTSGSMPTPNEVQKQYRERHRAKYALGGFVLWGVYTWALLAVLPAGLDLTWKAPVAVVAFFLAALTVDYPVRLRAGRELGYVGPPWEFGRWEHVEREWVGSIDTCYNCGEGDAPGVASRAVVDKIEWGLPGRRVESGTNYDCRSCAERLGHLPREPEPDWSIGGDAAGKEGVEPTRASRRQAGTDTGAATRAPGGDG